MEWLRNVTNQQKSIIWVQIYQTIFSHLLNESVTEISKELEDYTLEKSLSRIMVQKPISLQQLMVSIGNIEEYIKNYPEVI